jgi:glycosyltransferase involved in cell wall biosynthesis
MEKDIKLLHLCVDYPYTPLYKLLISSLSRFPIYQFIFVVLKKYKATDIGLNQDLSIPNTRYTYAPIVSILQRLFYFVKIHSNFTSIEKEYDWTEIDLIHSHYLFSDSGIAYFLNKKYSIPYITAVRNTDVNVFFRYFIHARRFGVKVMKNAEIIYFLSPAYKKYVLETYVPILDRPEIEKKAIVIPNGVNQFWLDNLMDKGEKKAPKKNINFIFIGNLDKNKNIHKTITILIALREEGFNVHFDIVGGDLSYGLLNKLLDKNKSFITCHGYIKDSEKIKHLLRGADIFIMPSQYESFGLVYIEAMSQGLPVIYRNGQGIDGYFPDGEIGGSINPDDIPNSIHKIKYIINNYTKISDNCIENAQQFSWEKITEQFFASYNQILNQKV